MAIVDVEIPSGYMYIQFSDSRRVIERQETRESNAIFYISSVRRLCIIGSNLTYYSSVAAASLMYSTVRRINNVAF